MITPVVDAVFPGRLPESPRRGGRMTPVLTCITGTHHYPVAYVDLFRDVRKANGDLEYEVTKRRVPVKSVSREAT